MRIFTWAGASVVAVLVGVVVGVALAASTRAKHTVEWRGRLI